MSLLHQRVNLSGIVVDLMDQAAAVTHIIDRVTTGSGQKPEAAQMMPLSVVSANLDHIVQFGTGGRWHGVIGDSLNPTWPLRSLDHLPEVAHRGMDWLTLLDGAPLVAQSRRLTGQRWPRLAGSDLIGPLLDDAEREGLSVGFLGGLPEVQQLLAQTLQQVRPGLIVSGFWAPDRSDLQDHQASIELAHEVKESHTDILVVGLGKPRQELWMAAYGELTGAPVLLAFGAVVDFLAGAVKRAPEWVSDGGLEWAWRLALEPRRLARRYLLNDPPGLIKIRHDSSLLSLPPQIRELLPTTPCTPRDPSPKSRFKGRDEHVDAAVLVVTYNNADTIDDLIASLRHEARSLDLRVIVADNGSQDATVQRLVDHPDVITVPTGANLGYAGGINAIRPLAGECDAVLILNPDLTVAPGAIGAMLNRRRISGAGIVVPRLLDSGGITYPSLRREPSLNRALGDALLGERLPQRPGWASEIDFEPESYAHPHRVDWSTGAALLVEAALERRLGCWDEQFFLYSEETDYFRRAREAGASVWYEPAASMTHHMGGSGTSVALNTLMAVNRIRYARKHHPARYAAAYAGLVALHEALRWNRPAHRGSFQIVINEQRWQALPTGTHNAGGEADFPRGTVIIPAHNEAKVITRTLGPLAELAAADSIEVIVACNGCTDDTAGIARSFPGVKVIDSPVPSKVAALNLAEAQASGFPRLYLDADIQITPAALRLTFQHLQHDGALAARPAFVYDTTGASFPVKAFYRARRRVPATNQALWGAGAYALSESGRQRFGAFPPVTADDLFVDQLFDAAEKQILPTNPVRVRTPRTTTALLAVLSRNYRGQGELRERRQDNAADGSTGQTLRQLARSISGPVSALDALIYSGLVMAGRLRARRTGRRSRTSSAAGWGRDSSSRQ